MEASPSCTRRLWPRPSRRPSPSKSAAPMGIPPSASPIRASSTATASMSEAAVIRPKLLRLEQLHRHRRAALTENLQADTDRRELHARVRLLGEPELLGVVERRLGRRTADVGRLAVDVQREGVR